MDHNKKNNEIIPYGTVRVSEKGQIALPAELRRDLAIGKGEQLFVMRKKGVSGFVMMRMDEVIEKMWTTHGDVFSGAENK